jgi:membrane protease YdiL (CAAX protease family)
VNVNAPALAAPSLVLSTRAGTWLGLAAVVATFVAVRALCAAAGLPRPGQFAVVGSALVAALLLARAGLTWEALGFPRPTRWLWTPLVGVALYVAATVAVVVVVHPLARALGLPPMRLEAFDGLRGDLPRLLVTLLMVWTTVSFGEELVFRGFVQKGLAGALSGGALPPLAVAILAVVGQALVFGALHGYLGPTGMLNAAVVGLVFGAGVYVVGGNLWPLVIAHGLMDTVGLVAVYAGVMPR